MDNVKIVRLQTGEDIVADCLDDENHLILDNPMHLIFKRGPAGGKVMVLLPWLPVEIIDSNIASVPYKDILMYMQPKKELINYYFETVDVINQQLNNSLSLNRLPEQDDEIHSKLLEKMLEEAIEEKKNNNIH